MRYHAPDPHPHPSSSFHSSSCATTPDHHALLQIQSILILLIFSEFFLAFLVFFRQSIDTPFVPMLICYVTEVGLDEDSLQISISYAYEFRLVNLCSCVQEWFRSQLIPKQSIECSPF